MLFLSILLVLIPLLVGILILFTLWCSTKPKSHGLLTVLSIVMAVVCGIAAVLFCFVHDTGIAAIPVVCILSLLLFRILVGFADRHGTARADRPEKLTLGSGTKLAKRFLLSSGSVILAVAVVILINLICTNLSDRFDWTLDLTASKLHSISQDTYDMLDDLSDDVSITVLFSQQQLESNTYGSNVATLLEKYNAASDHISLTYIDPYQNPSAVESFSEQSSNVSEGSTIIQCGDQTRVLNLIDYYDTQADSSSGYTYVSAFRGESALTSAILSVTSSDTPHAYVLQGHNESISSQLNTLLESSGYAVGSLTLAEDSIPQNASLLLLSLPQVDYTEDEVNALDDFVKQGGDLIVFDGTESPTDLPVLYSYLKEWGIEIHADMVLDSDYNISDARYLMAALTDTEINESLSSKSDQVIVSPDAKPLTVEEDDTATDRAVQTLLSSRDTAYSRPIDSDKTYDSYSKQKGDTDGPFDLAALAEYTGNDDGGQILVCSSALMISDQLMQSSSLLNKEFFRNVISAMQPDVELVSIDSKTLSAEPLTLSSSATYFVFLALLFLPLFLFGYGLIVFFRRRHL